MEEVLEEDTEIKTKNNYVAMGMEKFWRTDVHIGQVYGVLNGRISRLYYYSRSVWKGRLLVSFPRGGG